MKKKILIIRFSSIGDIVLTTPVIRSLRKALPDAEIHYLTKAAFADVLRHNPYLDQLHLLDNQGIGKQVAALKQAGITHVLDLHNNLRSWQVRLRLMRPARGFDKANFHKYRMVRGWADRSVALPHIVARYAATLSLVNVPFDGGGLDFFLPETANAEARQIAAHWGFSPGQTLAVVLGATHPTKRWIPEHFAAALNRVGQPVLLLGGKDARAEADVILAQLQVPHYDAVGKHPLLTAAALMRLCPRVLTHDTGFMHIAAAFQQPCFTLWGNTVPEFGMYPWQTLHIPLQVSGLACRPCSKIGHETCPEGHFRCMRDLSPEKVATALMTST